MHHMCWLCYAAGDFSPNCPCDHRHEMLSSKLNTSQLNEAGPQCGFCVEDPEDQQPDRNPISASAELAAIQSALMDVFCFCCQLEERQEPNLASRQCSYRECSHFACHERYYMHFMTGRYICACCRGRAENEESSFITY